MAEEDTGSPVLTAAVEEKLHLEETEGAVRQELSSSSSHAEESRPRLFEQFIVVGIDDSIVYPKEKAQVAPARKLLPFFNTVYDPKTLFRYPQETSLPSIKLESFCFPSGVRTNRIRKSASMGALNEIYFSQNYMFDTNHSYIFRLTNEGQTTYGMCITKEELVSEYPTFFPETHKNNKNIEEEQDSTNNREHLLVGARCYCIISKYPFFRLHFSVLHSILDHDRLSRIIQRQDLAEHIDPSMNSSHAIQDMLTMYYSQVVPSPGGELIFQLSVDMKAKRFICPREDIDNYCISEWTMVPSIKILPLDQLLLLFNTILLEKSIVVKSRKSLGTMANLVLSCIPLLRPFEWTGLLISLLPNNLSDVLQAPVPYIVGVNSLNTEVEALVIDLDNNKLINQDLNLPLLPEWKKLSHNIKMDYDKIHTGPEYFNSVLTPSDTQRDASLAILESLQKYVSWLLSKVHNYYVQKAVSDSSLDFKKVRVREEIGSEFVASVSPSNRKFMEAMMSTQHFSVWSSINLSDGMKLSQMYRPTTQRMT